MQKSLSFKIFLPYVIVFALLFTVSILGIVNSQNSEINGRSSEEIERSMKRFQQLESRDEVAINSVLKPILKDDDIKRLYQDRNIDGLYQQNIDTFNQIKELYGITHWYFIDTEGKVLLRMHNKGLSGDIVNRETFIKAKETQRAASGIELGKTAFALRVVEPYYNEDHQLIGYIELGQEIDHFLEQLSNDTGGKYAVIVDKDKINEKEYRSTVQQAGAIDEWDNGKDYVVLNKNFLPNSNEEIVLNNSIDSAVQLGDQISGSKSLGVKKLDNKYFSVGVFPIHNVSDVHVGVVSYTADITSTVVVNRTTLLLVVSLLIILIILGYLFYRFLMRRNVIYPISSIIKDTKEAVKTNFKSKIHYKSDDELGMISDSINHLISEIESSRSDIEQKVKLQTSDIIRQSEYLENQQKAVLNILEDIEEEKLIAEQNASDLRKFQLAVSEASDHIVITDSDGVIIYANKAVERITGYSPKEATGKKAGSKELWGGLMDISTYQKLWKTIKEDKETFIGVFSNRRKNGEIYEAEAHVAPILDDKKNVKYFVGIERDITKEREIDKAKTELVSLASHQLRTPLSAVSWYAEMLLSGDAGPLTIDQTTYLKEIYTGNKRMIELVNTLLNVSRIELGTFSIVPVPTDLVKVYEDVEAEMVAAFGRKKLKIKLTKEAKIPSILADPKLVRIILQNYISNAIKYSPAGKEITCDLSLVEINKAKYIQFKVCDKGFGIPKNQAEKIFSKLFRADNVRAMDTEGTGLGLYIVKSIMDASGGLVWFESKGLNKGSCFYAAIPITGMKQKEGTRELS
jgi:PAS domain S-box-containing protein